MTHARPHLPSTLLALALGPWALGCGPDVAMSELTEAPAITLSSPADGTQLVEGAVVRFEATVLDDRGDWRDATVSWARNGEAVCTPAPPAWVSEDNPDAGVALCEMEVRRATDGLLHVVAQVVDPGGLSSRTTGEWEVRDDAAPTVSIVDVDDANRDGQVCASERFTLTGHVADDVDGAADITVEWLVDGQPTTGLDASIIPLDDAGETQLELQLTAVGDVSVALVATDSKGHTNDAREYQAIEACGTPPVCDITSPEDGEVRFQDEIVRLQGDVDDVEDGPAGLTLEWSSHLDGALGQSNGGADGSTTLSVSDLSVGTHELALTCTDTDGNAVESVVGLTIEDCLRDWWPDDDGDGHGDPDATSVYTCDPPAGWVDNADDCDDRRASVYLDAAEQCDGLDNDCDGIVDEDRVTDPVNGVQYTDWFIDDDGDGYGDPGASIWDCVQPAGTVADDSDCDDTDATVSPAATEVCDGLDNDCDGLLDDDDSSLALSSAATWYADGDGDGHGDATSSTRACLAPSGTVADDTDCDDADGAVHPGATEVCDAIDNDCDGATDDADASLDTSTASSWYTDADGDGYGDAARVQLACAQPTGAVSDATDCDDGAASAHPGGSEVCDGLDNDCDGLTDADDPSVDTSTLQTWYRDADGDGYGSSGATQTTCSQPSGYVSGSTDCDDTDASVNPGATEVCDASDTDEDCNGLADDADSGAATGGMTRYYPDADSDGYGDDTSSGNLSCDPTGAYVETDNTDCDDSASGVNPGATEVCDSADVDEDCDGRADDADSSVVGQSTWYTDADGDGYGDASVLACDAPSNGVTTGGDCDDGDSSVHPGATEVCDSADVDEDCDGRADDADSSVVGQSTWYTDADGDGYGDASVTACDQPASGVSTGGDCDDSESRAHPGGTEVCDAIDNDCDGSVDDGVCVDLDVRSVSLSSSSLSVGSTPTATAQVRNDGGAASGSFIVEFFLHTSSRYSSSAVSVGSCTVSSLSAGSTDTCRATLSLGSMPSGTSTTSYSLIAYADRADVTGDSDTSNNTDTTSASWCGATTYWTPSSMTSSYASGSGTGHGGAQISFEVRENSNYTPLIYEFCKRSGTFTSGSSVHVSFSDSLDGTAGFSTTRSTSSSCIRGTFAAIGYAEGERLGGWAKLVSPSSVLSSWGGAYGTCGSGGSSTAGGCWHMASSTMTRTCK